MRKPSRTLVAAVTTVALPFLAGCFATVQMPVPALQAEREELNVRGVVDGDGRQVEFAEIVELQWTRDQLFFVGSIEAEEGGATVTRQYPLAGLQGVLVREMDAGKTSAVVGGLAVGALVTLALLISGSDPANR